MKHLAYIFIYFFIRIRFFLYSVVVFRIFEYSILIPGHRINPKLHLWAYFPFTDDLIFEFVSVIASYKSGCCFKEKRDNVVLH